jgi:hypothetical protein
MDDLALRVINALMYSENHGDIHDVINRLCDIAGIDKPEGNFQDGWTKKDRKAVEGHSLWAATS